MVTILFEDLRIQTWDMKICHGVTMKHGDFSHKLNHFQHSLGFNMDLTNIMWI